MRRRPSLFFFLRSLTCPVCVAAAQAQDQVNQLLARTVRKEEPGCVRNISAVKATWARVQSEFRRQVIDGHVDMQAQVNGDIPGPMFMEMMDNLFRHDRGSLRLRQGGRTKKLGGPMTTMDRF